MLKVANPFIQSLNNTNWLSRIGDPIDHNEVITLHNWEKWPGPEDEGVLKLHDEHQETFELFIAPDEDLDEAFLNVMMKIQERVAQKAGIKVREDSSHAQSVATWQIGFTAGLVFAFEYLNEPLPEFIAVQWDWILKGHWPAGYSNEKLLIL